MAGAGGGAGTGTGQIGTSGALSVIARTVLAAPAATIDFTSIPATYESLLVQLTGESSQATTSTGIDVRFNNDSGANYDGGRVTQVTAATATAQTSVRIGALTGTTGTANSGGAVELLIPNYARTVFHKTGIARNTFKDAANAPFVEHDGIHWRSTAAIDRVTLILPGGGNFVIGSVATLYGIAGA